jgi:hypothetical protein
MGQSLKEQFVKNTFKKKDVSHKEFLEDLGLLIVKNNLPIQFVEKKNELYVLLTLTECYSTTISFDLWMFKGVNDVFALVIIFLSND